MLSIWQGGERFPQEENAKSAENKTLKSDLKRLKDELGESNEELVRLRGQEQENIALNQRLARFEEKMDEVVTEKVEQKEAEIKEIFDTKVNNFREREMQLQKQLDQANEQIIQLKSSHDNTQAKLIGHGEKNDEETAAKLAELDIVVMDLERASAKIVELEGENEVLKNEVQAARDERGSDERIAEYERRYAEQEGEISKLIKQIESLRQSASQSENVTSSRKANFESTLSEKEKEIQELKSQLRERKDYIQIKNELEILKSVEFANELDEAQKTNGVNGDTKPGSLEKLLMLKNRKMENELTNLKLTLQQVNTDLVKAQEEFSKAQSELTDQKSLTKKLEEDLSNVNARRSVSSITDPLSTESRPSSPFLNSSNDNSIIPILTSQRDRFRQRNFELEEEVRGLNERISDLGGELESLREDNVKLYEKIQYISSYRNDGPSKRNVNTVINVDNTYSRNDNVADRYSSMYEENLNPFQAYKKKEESRRYNSLNPVERTTLNIARHVLANKNGRYFLIAYSFLLHFIVLITLYKLSQWQDCELYVPSGLQD
ncbi:hypothetical protein K493DRAFT_106982 [Basidiobolus meristosporus CBS 931.73]|uniref:CASP C-terminal domain-containing protein n=1 Tax=Basidiobolus meristosporus CBS 931.73 TaxID=1314790 RepID=A0A1Y1YPE8_9FUNG|nr:hypothetical protein K493DRAFT_14260 [Basidiobolus meristosporus CBS 931.73]ORX99910.1 hypothetical protein K493DRAFT_106982 [Basidiobolus meristosporus CBS 931.73]|eukprot:ORX63384.1 hypothetical protein K493DRAFT_14260 [Basidiobolus meristosporus CBS 931.73]